VAITNNTESNDPSCSHRINATYIVRRYVDNRPEGLVDVTVRHRYPRCSLCGQIFPFSVGSSHFATLSEVSKFAVQNQLKSITVTMNCDALNLWDKTKSILDTIDIRGTFILDMNGCDMERQVVLLADSVSIINSKIVDTTTGQKHYAHFTYASLDTKEDGKVSIDGCDIHMLSINSSSARFTMGDVSVGSLDYENPEKLIINAGGQLVVKERLRISSNSGEQYLPKGYLLKECLANGSWVRRYDHTSKLPLNMGPVYDKTGSVAFMPCTQHKLSSASSYDDTYHQGVCVYCKDKVLIQHDMTDGTSSTDYLHTIKCSLCTYTNGTAYHDYGANGKCVVKNCQHAAPVSVHGHYSPNKVYFSSFDEAFTAVNSAGMYDTISMYSNQAVHAIGTLDSAVVYSFKAGKIVYGPYIHIQGNQCKLTNDRGHIKIPVTMKEQGMYALEMSGNVSVLESTNRLPITIAKGYQSTTTKEKYGSIGSISLYYYYKNIYPCTHSDTTFTYAQVKDAYGNIMAYHKKTCDNCGHVTFEDHIQTPQETGTFKVNWRCQHCSVLIPRSIAARVSYTKNGETFVYGYHTLKDAWQAACDSSRLNNVVCTVQVLKDIKLIDESTEKWWMSIPQDGPVVMKDIITFTQERTRIILDATDDEGIVHSITGWGSLLKNEYADTLIAANSGSLTIKSGIFQGFKWGIFTKYSTSTYLKLMGGTFKNGIASNPLTGKIYDALVSDGGVPPCVEIGYVLVTRQKGTMVSSNKTYVGNVLAGGRYLITLNKNITMANGVVMACPHPSIFVSNGVKPTCTSQGHPAYQYCSQCCIYTYTETGKRSSYLSPDMELGHEFDENHDCIRCGLREDAIVLYGEDSDGNQVMAPANYTDFSLAYVYSDGYSTPPAGSKFSMTLNADVTVPEDYFYPYDFVSDLTIDLNGHSLNLNNLVFPVKRNITIVDGTHSGNSVLTGVLEEVSDKTYTLKLDGVRWNTSNFNCKNLVMTNGAGICFDGGIKDDVTVAFGKVAMENGCWMEGNGMSHFVMNGANVDGVIENDLGGAITDLNHVLVLSQQDCHGNWIPALGEKNHFNILSQDANGNRKVWVQNRISVSYCNTASTCYRWHAEMQDMYHTHPSSGRYCSYCNMNTQHYCLKDRTSYTSSSAMQYKKAYYNCNFSNSAVANWNALYLPMSFEPAEYADSCDIADIYSYGRICDTNGNGKIDDNDDIWLIVDIMKSGVADANYPYFIRPKHSGAYNLFAVDGCLARAVENSVSCSTSRTKYTFTGVNTSKTLSAGNNYYYMTNGSKLTAVTNSVTQSPQRWYMQMSSNGTGYKADMDQASANGIRVMVIGEDLTEETAIQLLQGESVDVWQNGERYTLDGRKATTTQSGLQILNGKTIMIK